MSVPVKGSVIVADGNGRVSVITPTSDNQVLMLDSNEAVGARFVNIKNLLPPQAQKVPATSSNSTNASSYQTILTLTVPGENVNAISSIDVLSYIDNGASNYDIRIYDSTNDLIISEVNCTNNNISITNINTLNNLPTSTAIIEIQTRKNNGNSQRYVHVLEATINYTFV